MISTPVRKESLKATIARLERYLYRFERRYEVPSEKMVELVKGGQLRETAEIGQWLSAYRRLAELQAGRRPGRTTGTRTTPT